jgi:hypothetical protein
MKTKIFRRRSMVEAIIEATEGRRGGGGLRAWARTRK